MSLGRPFLLIALIVFFAACGTPSGGPNGSADQDDVPLEPLVSLGVDEQPPADLASGYRVSIERELTATKDCSFGGQSQRDVLKEVAEGEMHFDWDFPEGDNPYTGTGEATTSVTYQQDPCPIGADEDNATCRSTASFTGDARLVGFAIGGAEASGVEDPDPDVMYLDFYFEGVGPATLVDPPDQCSEGEYDDGELTVGTAPRRSVPLPAAGGKTTDTFEELSDPAFVGVSRIETIIVEIEEIP